MFTQEIYTTILHCQTDTVQMNLLYTNIKIYSEYDGMKIITS